MNASVRKLVVLAYLGGASVGALGLTVACQRAPKSVQAHSRSLVEKKHGTSPTNARKNEGRAIAEPTTLFQESASAYGARVFPREDEIIVTTPTRLIRFREGRTTETHDVEMGYVTAALEDAIVFWRKGALRALSLQDLGETKLEWLKESPQYLATSGQRMAWSKGESEGGYVIQTLSTGSIQQLHASANALLAPVIHEESVYFVESSQQGWRIGRAPLDGSPVTFGTKHEKRRPSMLAAGPDGIYFYDGPRRSVMKLDFSLHAEQVVRKGAICSPLAVSSRVVCAQVGGIWDIPRPGADPRLVARETGGPIASIALGTDAAFWIADSGENQLTVKSVQLAAL